MIRLILLFFVVISNNVYFEVCDYESNCFYMVIKTFTWLACYLLPLPIKIDIASQID